MFPRSRLGEPGKLLRRLRLVFVHEHLDDMLVRHQLDLYQPCRRLVGACLVYWLLSRHAEGDNDIALSILEQPLRRYGQVLDPRDGHSFYFESSPGLLQLINSHTAHIYPGEGRVYHADLLHRFSTPASLLSISWNSTIFLIILRVPSRS